MCEVVLAMGGPGGGEGGGGGGGDILANLQIEVHDASYDELAVACIVCPATDE
jgi:hypothetical protein